MNKKERVLKGWYKFKKRLTNIGLWNEKDKPENNLNCYRTTGKPCSCLMCSGLKYSRKEKHKNKQYDTSN